MCLLHFLEVQSQEAGVPTTETGVQGTPGSWKSESKPRGCHSVGIGGFTDCLAFCKCSINICSMNDGIRDLHGAFQYCFSDLARVFSSFHLHGSFQKWRLWLSGVRQARGQEGMERADARGATSQISTSTRGWYK